MEFNEIQKRKKRRLDILGLVGILLIVIGGIWVYFEGQKCNYPLQTLIENIKENTELSEAPLDYSYAEISFYDGELIMPMITYKIYYNGSAEVVDCINKVDPNEFFGVEPINTSST